MPTDTPSDFRSAAEKVLTNHHHARCHTMAHDHPEVATKKLGQISEQALDALEKLARQYYWKAVDAHADDERQGQLALLDRLEALMEGDEGSLGYGILTTFIEDERQQLSKDQ